MYSEIKKSVEQTLVTYRSTARPKIRLSSPVEKSVSKITP